MKRFFLALMLMVSVTNHVLAQQSDFTWITNTVGGITNIILTSWHTNSLNVTIPDVITNSTPPNLPVVSFGRIFNTDTNEFNKSHLTSLIIGNNITNIETAACEYLIYLNNLVIGSSVKVIGTNAFHACSSLENINIPNSVVLIDSVAFKSCAAATNLTIGTGPNLSIGLRAFGYCSRLVNVFIPANVRNFLQSSQASPWDGCDGVTNYVVDAANIWFYSTNGAIFRKTTPTFLYQYPAGRAGSVSFLDINLQTIGTYSMAYNALTTIEIPTNTTTINDSAFAVATNLQNIIFYGNIPSFGKYVFSKTAANPTNTISAIAYITRNATGWPIPPNLITLSSGVGIPVRYMEILLTVINGSGSGTYTNGDYTTRPIVATNIPHKVFKSWTGDTQYVANVNSASTDINMPNLNIDITVTATYNDIYYNLTVINGSGTSSNLFQDTHTIIASNKLYKTFRAWTGPTQHLVSATSQTTTVRMPDSNITFTATYTDTLYTLSVTGGTGGGLYTNASVVSIFATNKPHQTFKAWTGSTQYLANATSQTTTVTMPGSNITLIATYNNVYYNLTVVDGSGTSSNLYHDIINITASNYPPSIFKAWTGPIEHVASATSSTTTVTMPSSNITLTATYVSTCIVTIVNGTGSGVYNVGDNVPIAYSNFVYNGEIFLEWTGDTEYIWYDGGGNPHVTCPAQNITITAVYRPVFSYTTNTENHLVLTEWLTRDAPDVIVPEYINGRSVVSFGGIFSETALSTIEINGVTEIDDSAFGMCFALKSVGINSTITNVGMQAFYNCIMLTNVAPLYMTTIKYITFYACDNLSVVDVPLATTIEEYAFGYCPSLSFIDISLVTNIGSYAFESDDNLNINIPSNIISIGDFAFSRAGLKNIILPNSLVSLGGSAFSGNIHATNVIIGTGLGYISEYAFANGSFGYINIPDNIFTIGDSAFIENNLNKVIIGTNLNTIGYNAFYNNESLTNITFSGNAPIFVNNCFGLDGGLAIPTTAYILQSKTGWPIPTNGVGHPSIPTAYWYDSPEWIYTITSNNVTLTQYIGTNTDIIIPDTIEDCQVVNFGDTLANNNTLKNVVVGTNITVIADGAFINTTSLTNVVIPNSVIVIDGSSFCNSIIKNIIIPSSVTSIGDSAFLDCRQLTSVIIGNHVAIIGSMAFNGCYSLTNIIIPNSVTSIGGDVFQDCLQLTSAIIGNGISVIGAEVFVNCTNLNYVQFGSNVASIGSDVFTGCYALTNITFMGDMPSFGFGCFSYVDSIIPATAYILSSKSGWPTPPELVGPTDGTSLRIPTAYFSLGNRMYIYGINNYSTINGMPASQVSVHVDGK